MTTQLTLISVPATPARQDAGAEAAEADVTTGSAAGGADRRITGPVALPHLDPTAPAAAATTPAGTAATGTPRRSPGYTGWLDGRTISSGRKGVAAARAALADATQRVADREALAAADRQDRLERQARGADRSDRHAA